MPSQSKKKGGGSHSPHSTPPSSSNSSKQVVSEERKILSETFFERITKGIVDGPTAIKPLEEACKRAHDVPMEYRAQARGRGQRQFIQATKKSPIEQWLDEWVKFVDSSSPFTRDGLQIYDVQIDWRLISNSGIDDGIIRPVTGAGGWPLIPGSSIKGLFRRACRRVAPDQMIRWCGGFVKAGEDNVLQPGLLRFHGAWPADNGWKIDLLDVTHPQQKWQVGIP